MNGEHLSKAGKIAGTLAPAPTRHTPAGNDVVDEPRPLDYWFERYPPGWLSRHTAQTADVIAIAAMAKELTFSFLDWLALSRDQRWDTFTRQALSAVLFDRYLVEPRGGAAPIVDTSVGLLQLRWPPGSEAIYECVARLQARLAAPFAVFKALRSAVEAEGFPTPAELALADDAIAAARDELQAVAQLLGSSLEEFLAENRKLSHKR